MIINRLNYVFHLLRYLLTARSKYRVHSPFVYHFYTEVILAKNKDSTIDEIENIRSSLLKQTSLLEISDFGAGARGGEYRTRFRQVRSVTRHSSISRKFGKLLFRIVKENKPENMLEIGTSMGISTMYISSASPQSRVLTLEGCAVIAEKAISNFKLLDLRNIEMSQGHFNHTFIEAVESFDRIDFAYLDGNHHRESTLEYFSKMLPKFHPGSIFIIDDIHWSRGMTGAWKEICKHKKVSITIDLFRLGIVFFKEDIAKEDFVLRF